ncbi:MAG: PepSY domain-containing protein [Moraxella sp.]|nr:PepSY domain-containing protein [Moraxella sp.]
MKAVILSAVMGIAAMSAVFMPSVAMADDDRAERQAQSAAKLSQAQARSVAVKAVGGGKVTDIDFDVERGRSVYDVEVRSGNKEYQVKIDANTGAVIRKRLDD